MRPAPPARPRTWPQPPRPPPPQAPASAWVSSPACTAVRTRRCGRRCVVRRQRRPTPPDHARAPWDADAVDCAAHPRVPARPRWPVLRGGAAERVRGLAATPATLNSTTPPPQPPLWQNAQSNGVTTGGGGAGKPCAAVRPCRPPLHPSPFLGLPCSLTCWCGAVLRRRELFAATVACAQQAVACSHAARPRVAKGCTAALRVLARRRAPAEEAVPLARIARLCQAAGGEEEAR